MILTFRTAERANLARRAIHAISAFSAHSAFSGLKARLAWVRALGMKTTNRHHGCVSLAGAGRAITLSFISPPMERQTMHDEPFQSTRRCRARYQAATGTDQ